MGVVGERSTASNGMHQCHRHGICTYVCIYVYIYMYISLSLSLSLSIYIYIYICCGVIIWAKFGLLRCYYLGQVCFFTKHCLSKNTIKIGVSALFFWKKNCARKFEVLLSGPSWSFLRCSQLGPNNNTYLAQITTPQNAFFFVFFVFFAFKNSLKYLFL